MAKKGTAFIPYLVFALGALTPASGQTCSCGGAPLLGFVDGGVSGKGLWRVGWDYEYSDISDLASGNAILPINEGIQRNTQSAILKIHHGLTSTISLTAMIIFVQKERVISDALKVRSIGDGVLLLQTNLLPGPHYPQRELIVGAGIKYPLGSSTLKYEGKLIASDMQPSSGATDVLITAYGSREMLMPLAVRAFFSISYRYTGTNSRFDFIEDAYRIGNEFNANLGAAYTLTDWLVLSLMGHYRSSAPNIANNWEVPNTGGSWTFIVPGVFMAISDKLSLGLSGQIPMSYRLNGALQFTTRYSISSSLSYRFGKSDNQAASSR